MEQTPERTRGTRQPGLEGASAAQDVADYGRALGTLVRQLRGKKKQQVAAREIGIGRSTLANVERGEVPGAEVFGKIVNTYSFQRDRLVELYQAAREASARDADADNADVSDAAEGARTDALIAGAARPAGIDGEWHALWQTTVEGEELFNSEVLEFSWHGLRLVMENRAVSDENPVGGYLWRGVCRVYDNQYIIGTYSAREPGMRMKGTLYAVLHQSGRFMQGRWCGCSYDSDWGMGLMVIARSLDEAKKQMKRHLKERGPGPYAASR